jgi:hypothetical protein
VAANNNIAITINTMDTTSIPTPKINASFGKVFFLFGLFKSTIANTVEEIRSSHTIKLKNSGGSVWAIELRTPIRNRKSRNRVKTNAVIPKDECLSVSFGVLGTDVFILYILSWFENFLT